MRISYTEAMGNPAHYLPLAKAAEAAGWDGTVIPDSICYPEFSDTKYPYTPDGSREFLEGKPFIEPFSLIPAMAAVTEKLRFATFVVKLPIREPVLVAKQMTSVACLSGNRFAFGVGVSPWPEDFEVCNQPWKRRGKRMNEMIEILRGLQSGEYFSYKGEFYDLPSIKLCPVPSQPVPILIGGHSDAALRRAARLGDGWMHAGGDPAELDTYLARLQELRREYDRENEPFELHIISMDAYSVDGLKRLEDKGITDVIIGFRDFYRGSDIPYEEKLKPIETFANDIIARFRG
ncbi:MAG: TIGR03619 family F420-dependent LLM class oxidoreductase [Deltaproteobacteria bacterium]